MKITAAMVKALRTKTGAGMMNCKKALVQHEGNIEEAMKYLQVKGLAATVKRAGRASSEGIVYLHIEEGANSGVLLEVNCETDFVARNEGFQGVVKQLAAHIAAANPTYLNKEVAPAGTASDEILSEQVLESAAKSVGDFMIEKASQIGENLVIKRFAKFSIEGAGVVAGYIHHDKKTGVMISLSAGNDGAASNEATKTLAKHLSMHIAAAKPLVVDSSSVDADLVAKQRALYEAQGLETGKPANIVAKIAEGRTRKWLKEVCLVEQPFVMDSDKSVTKVLKEVGGAVGGDLGVVSFQRFVIGEDIKAEA